MKRSSPPSKTGRPREFDPAAVLEQAMRVFWQKGYEGASLKDLTDAMGINRPSLYATFGNKQSLFRKSIDRYSELAQQRFDEALAMPSARETAERFLLMSVPGDHCRGPRGCMLVQSAMGCGSGAESMKRIANRRRSELEAMLLTRFEKAVAQGDLPASADPIALAKFITAVGHGMSVQASGGATADDLRTVVSQAIKVFPKSGRPVNEAC